MITLECINTEAYTMQKFAYDFYNSQYAKATLSNGEVLIQTHGSVSGSTPSTDFLHELDGASKLLVCHSNKVAERYGIQKNTLVISTDETVYVHWHEDDQTNRYYIYCTDNAYEMYDLMMDIEP